MELTKISKKLSYMLRHSTEPLYIDLNGGWADVNIIMKALREKYPQVSGAILDEIVANDEKGRYSFNDDRKKSEPIRDIRYRALSLKWSSRSRRNICTTEPQRESLTVSCGTV